MKAKDIEPGHVGDMAAIAGVSVEEVLSGKAPKDEVKEEAPPKKTRKRGVKK